MWVAIAPIPLNEQLKNRPLALSFLKAESSTQRSKTLRPRTSGSLAAQGVLTPDTGFLSTPEMLTLGRSSVHATRGGLAWYVSLFKCL